MKMDERNKKYVEFMYNIDNAFNCYECPANEGFDNVNGRYPCGQFNCWVAIHCESRRKREEGIY